MEIKKEYVAPNLDVVELEMQPELLACSTDPSKCMGEGGTDDNGRY